MEIERKFLVPPQKFDEGKFHEQAHLIQIIHQGYFTVSEEVSIRVRLATTIKNRYGVSNVRSATITMKTKTPGAARLEINGEVSFDEFEDAEQFFALCPNQISKQRYSLYSKERWEIDVFYDLQENLIIAEIELDNVNATFGRPSWVGPEITDEKFFYNENLNSKEYLPIWKTLIGEHNEKTKKKRS